MRLWQDQATRWTTDPFIKSTRLHAIDLRALCKVNLVTSNDATGCACIAPYGERWLCCAEPNGTCPPLGFRVQGSGFRGWDRVQGSGVRVQGSGCRVQGSGFRVKVSGLRVEG